jgi:glycosyltransferase involved in cell wall biosynthesis
VPAKVCVMTSAHSAFDARIFHKQCRSLARGGYEVTLIAPGAGESSREGVHLDPLPTWKSRWSRMVRGPLAVYRKALRQRADVYHFHDPELLPIGILLRLGGKQVIYDVHEDLPRTVSYKSYIPRPLRAPVAACLERLERWAARCFSALITATPPIAERFRRDNAVIEVIHNYPRMDEIQAAPAAQRIEESDSLLYVGMRVTRARGAEEMVRAMGLLPASIPARLTIVGAWDPPSLPEELAKVPGWDRTHSLGMLGREDLARVLQQARVGLVLLHAEPNYVTALPVKLFEYMCAGLPVIASDLPGCRDIVESSRCGLLVNPLSPDELAEAITYLWTHPEEARAMGARGAEAVRQRYNWANEEKRLLALYQRFSLLQRVQSAEPERCHS